MEAPSTFGPAFLFGFCGLIGLVLAVCAAREKTRGDGGWWLPGLLAVGFAIVIPAMLAVAFAEDCAGSVRAERNLERSIVYVVSYASATPVGDEGYLVVLEKRGEAKEKPVRRVYALPVRPPNVFYVVDIEGKIRYVDAAEVR